MSYPPQYQPTPPSNMMAGEPPLWAPYYGAPIGAAVRRFWKKYATFSGRASRSEYWWWFLVSFVVTLVLQVLSTIAGAAGATTSANGSTIPGPGGTIFLIITVVWALATIVPNLALLARRLHDGNFSGWLILLGLIPFLGAIALFVFSVLPPNPAGQRFDRPTA